MIHCWLKAYLNFRGCQQTGRWFDLPRGPRLLLFSRPPPSLPCSVSGNRSSLWCYESLCLCAALALLPSAAKGLACLWGRASLAFKFLTGLLLLGLGVVRGGGVNAWLNCSLSLQQLLKAFFPQILPTQGRQGCGSPVASQKLHIYFMLEEYTWLTNSSQQVG